MEGVSVWPSFFSTSQLSGVLLRTQGNAVSSLRLLVEAVEEKVETQQYRRPGASTNSLFCIGHFYGDYPKVLGGK